MHPAPTSCRPPDLPRCPAWSQIVRLAGRCRQPLTGYRRGWFVMIRPVAAYAIRLWPEAQVWVAEEGRDWRRSPVRERGLLWRRCYAEFDPDEPVTAERRQEMHRAVWNRRHLEALFGTLPSAQQAVLRQLKGDDGFLVLKFAQASRGGLELLHCNPGLGYMLATRRFTPQIGWTAAVALAGQRQRVILQALGFPPSERLRKIFARLPLSQMNARTVKILRKIFTDTAVLPLLSGVEQLNFELVQWLRCRDSWHLYTPRLIVELSQLGEMEDQFISFPHIWTLTEAAKAGRWQPRPLLSYRHSAKMVAALPRPPKPPRESLPSPLPAPPCPGDDTITPLTTDHALADEGDLMRHCLGDARSIRAALQGGSAYYRVLAPERCTLQLQRDPTGTWRMGCLLRSKNREPARATIDAVKAKFAGWLGGAYVPSSAPPEAE
ncbi:MAG: hypothetical protein KIT44_09020 [Opitutaceae bacterium]|nr:hypothetical protein [Opitutaceae bacterium]